jgi:hypothetical protein
MPKRKRKNKKIPPGSVLAYLGFALNCEIEPLLLDSDIGDPEQALEALRNCPLDSVCGYECRRIADATANLLRYVIGNLEDHDEAEALRLICLDTCAVVILG